MICSKSMVDSLPWEKNDLGHTMRVKYKMWLNDYTPFKERYRRVPPHLYEEVRKHLKEMVER